MFNGMRSAGAVLAGVGLLGLSPALPGQGPEERPAPARDRTEPIPSLRADAALIEKLDATRDYLQSETWARATRLLRTLLDGGEDALLPVKSAGRGGQKVVRWTGVRREAARLLGTLPPEGREFYETTYGARAAVLLADARRRGDLRLAEEVARRYPHTDAGAEATRLLGVYHLDGGRPTLAALCFRRLLERRTAGELSPLTLYHATLAFRRAGDAARAASAWERLADRAPDGLRLGRKTVSLAALRRDLARGEVPGPAGPASGPEVGAGLEVSWTRATAYETATRSWLAGAVQRQEAEGRPILAASLPVVVGDRLVYRSHRGLHAADVRTGKEAWEVPSAWSIDRMAPHPSHSSHLEMWVDSYLQYSPHVLFGNAVVGTLSTDGARVYAVDDLAVPPYRQSYRFRGRWRQEPGWPDFGAELNGAAYHSRLLALDAASGKPAWEAGGRRPRGGPLSDTYFLGPPLVLDGRLYLLAEKNYELVLICLNAADGALVWRQALALAPASLLIDPGRRLQAARPVYADGLLVCPTNAGLVVGVDLLTRDLAWAYAYRTEYLTRTDPVYGRRGRASPARVATEWEAPLLAVQQGRVLLAAPDEPSLHCLRLRDGALLWKVRRAEDDLYVAGVLAGRVLVVGKQSCRALDPAGGRQLWQTETGMPSGRGVAAGHVYYLPLKQTGKEKGPAVCVLDVRKGSVLGRVTPPAAEARGGKGPPTPPPEPPGNLLLWRGEVLSQTVTSITAYGRKKDGTK